MGSLGESRRGWRGRGDEQWKPLDSEKHQVPDGDHPNLWVIFFFFLDTQPGVGLLGHVLVLVLDFEDPPYCYPW